MTTQITSESVIIEWRVPFITTLEQYIVLYGTSMDNLDQTSGTTSSVANVSAVNQMYSVNLVSLEPFTTYFYQVRATNDHFSTLSETRQFITLEEGI